MAEDNGVFFSMAGPNASRLDVLRAKVRSSQQKIVASSKNILQNQQRETFSRGLEPSGAVVMEVGEGSTTESTTSSTGPLHMQHHHHRQQQQDDSVTQLLQEQLRLVYADRASMKAEISSLERKHSEREASLQSEVMSFRYKYDVLKKEMELMNESRQGEDDFDQHTDMRDDASPIHRQDPSSPPKKEYFQFAFGRNGSFVEQANRHRREQSGDSATASVASDSTIVLKLRDEIESFKAKEKNYTNEILFLQMEIQRIQLEQERLSDLDMQKPWLKKGTTTLEVQRSNQSPTGGLEATDTTGSIEGARGSEENNEVDSQLDAEMDKTMEKTREDLVELEEVFSKLEQKNKQVEDMATKLKLEHNAREEEYIVLQQRNRELEQMILENQEVQEETNENSIHLSRRCMELEEKNRVLEARCKDLEEKTNEILNMQEDLKKRNQELEVQCKKVETENQEFGLMYDEIHARSNDLLRQNDELESKAKALEAKNLELDSQQAKLEDKNRVQSKNFSSLKNQLVSLSTIVDKKEKTVQITNGTTARSSEVVVPISHSVSLYDSVYCNPSIRASRVRTWPKEIAENVRRKRCKVICTMLDDDGDTTAVFDIEELKKLSTSVLFQSSDYAHQEKIIMVLRWIPLGECHSTSSYQEQSEPSGMHVHISNGHFKRSKELYMPLSDAWTVFETVYNHEGVKAVIRVWPRDVVWRVTNQRSRIVCRAFNGENEFAKYSIDDLESLTLRNLYRQAGSKNPARVLLELVEETIVKEEELYRPFTSRGFRQRGWTTKKTQSKLKVRLKNEATQRYRDMLVVISSDLSLFDAVYNCEEAHRANIRKWKSRFVREVKSDLSRILCVFLGSESEIRSSSVESLKTITTMDAKRNLSNMDGAVNIVLRCVKTKKGAEASRHEEMRLRIVNHTTRRTMFLYVPYSEELTLYESVYNNPEVRASQVRMWPKEVLHAIKDETATIQCHLFDGQASENELQVFSIQKLKETSTKRLFDLIPSPGDVPQLVLKYHTIGREKTEIMVLVSNAVTGRFKEVEVPVSQDMTLHDIIYQNSTIKYSYVRMWPSEIVQKVKNKTAEIHCVMRGKEQEITFSIEDMKKTTTSQLVELSPPPYDLVRLVLKYKEIENKEKETASKEVKDIQIRITNQTTSRFRDLTVPISKDLSLYRSIYNNRNVKVGKVRVWPGKLLQDLKQKVVEVECAVLSNDGQIIYTYSVDGMRSASSQDLFELARRSGERIQLLLRCETKAYTGDSRGRLKEIYRPRGFRQRGWLPKASSPRVLQVRLRNELTNRSIDLIVATMDFSSNMNDVIYDNPAVRRLGVRRWPTSVAKGIKQGSSEVLCFYAGINGNPMGKLTIKELSHTSIEQLFGDINISGRIEMSLRCVATSVAIIDVDGDDSMVESEKVSAEKETNTLTEASDSIPTLHEDDRNAVTFAEEVISNTGKSQDVHNVSDILTIVPTPKTALYPEVFIALGFQATQGKAVEQVLGMYPEVLQILGFEEVNENAAKCPIKIHQREPIQLTAEAEIYGLYSEVFRSLGFSAAKKEATKSPRRTNPHEPTLEMVPNDALRQSPEELSALDGNTEKDLLGIYPGVFKSLGFENLATTSKETMLGMYPGVLASLGFQKITAPFELEKTEDEGIECHSVTSESSSEKAEVSDTESMSTTSSLSIQASGFRNRGGWLPVASGFLHFRVRLTNETNGRSRDLVVPVSDSLTLFDAVYNEQSVQRANIREFPAEIALAVKQKACEIIADVFIPRYGPIDQRTSFFGDSSDILIDDEGTAICSFTLDDFRQTTTVEIFELMAQPRDVIKVVLRVKKVEAVDLLESKVSALEQQLRIASEQAKNGSELLAEKLKALDEATNWNEQLSGELEELRAGVNGSKPPSPRSDMVAKAKKQTEILEQKEKALEQASERNENLKIQVAQLQKEIEILEVAANSSILQDHKSVVDHVIEEEDDRDELSEDVSFKPIGFRQRGWLAEESASMDMRLRVTNESTQKTKDFVLPIDDELTVYDAVYPEGSAEDILEKTSNIQCVAWHDMGKDVRTFSVNALQQMSTKKFFELASRRQDLLRALMRCQETAKSQVQELESEVHVIQVRNEELQSSMCVLSNELATSVAKYNKVKRELDTLKQSQEGGLLFATELFEI